MDFRKKLKTRLYTAIIMIATGIMFIGISAFVSTENEFLSSFGDWYSSHKKLFFDYKK